MVSSRCLSIPLLLICVLLTWSASVCAARTGADEAAPPAQVAQAFYGWYLQELCADRNPIDGSPQVLQQYLSSALQAEIQAKIHSPDGLESDYFIKAQDYLGSWCKVVSARLLREHGSQAIVLVVLGDPGPETWRLQVTLWREHGRAWRIRRVAKAPA
jgi:hypothetical protein